MSEQSKEATTDSMACLETASAQPQSSLSGGESTLQAEDGRAAELMTKFQSLDTEAKESRREVKHLKAKLKNAASTAAAMRRSTSWRITKPLRLVSRGARWILRKARRALTLAWGLDSGQSGRADEGSYSPSLNLGKLPKSGPAAKVARKSKPTTTVTPSNQTRLKSLAAAKAASNAEDCHPHY